MSLEFKTAKGHGQMGGAAWFDRHRKTRMRAYHVFSIRRMVCADGHLWVVIIGPYAIAWGHTVNKGRRGRS